METDVITTQTKTCLICKRTLPLDDFHKDRTRGDGYKARCRTCSSRRVHKVIQERQQSFQKLTVDEERKRKARVVALKKLVEMYNRDFTRLVAVEYQRLKLVEKTWQPILGEDES